MSFEIDEKDYTRSALSRKVLQKDNPHPEEAEAEDKNIAALRELAQAVKAVAEKPAPSMQPLLAALQQVQETQTKLLKLLAERPGPAQPVREWEFKVRHNNRGEIELITAQGI